MERREFYLKFHNKKEFFSRLEFGTEDTPLQISIYQFSVVQAKVKAWLCLRAYLLLKFKEMDFADFFTSYLSLNLWSVSSITDLGYCCLIGQMA